MDAEQRALAQAWYRHLREWRIIVRQIEPGRVLAGEIPNIRMVAGDYVRNQNGAVRSLEPLVLTPVGPVLNSELVRAIEAMPLDVRMILNRVRMAPKTGREGLPKRPPKRGYEIACLMLAEAFDA